jgi:hypothetical protein
MKMQQGSSLDSRKYETGGARVASPFVAANSSSSEKPIHLGHYSRNADLKVCVCLVPTALHHAEPGATSQELNVPDNQALKARLS